jgi:glycosyltransferase involved in cell wall biosynthesis
VSATPPAAPLVSVIVPAYGHEELALKAVRSALAQDHRPLEVLLVDDASPDTRFEAVRAIDDPRLRVHRNPSNLGRVANYRHALTTLARGDWVINLDGDDEFTDPQFVRHAVAATAANPRAVLVAARCTTLSRHGRHASPGPGNVVVPGVDVVRALPRRDYLFMHLSTMYRRDLAIEIDFYRQPTISSDWESLYRLALRGDVVFIDRDVGLWRLHGSNTSATATWQGLAANLGVWPSIFRSAVQDGLDPRTAAESCRRCLIHFGRLQLPAAMRGQRLGDGVRYLRALWQLDRRAALTAIASLSTLMRLAAGSLGYYRGRAF